MASSFVVSRLRVAVARRILNVLPIPARLKSSGDGQAGHYGRISVHRDPRSGGSLQAAHACIAASRRVPPQRPASYARRRGTMTGALVTPRDGDLAAMAKSKLATTTARAAELDHLVRLLHRDEQVVTLCVALFRSGRQARRGLIALTDERLICVDSGSGDVPPAELLLGAIPPSLLVERSDGAGSAQ